MKKILIIMASFAFAVGAVILVYIPAKPLGLTIGVAGIGVVLAFIVWPRHQEKTVVPKSTSSAEELQRIYILVLSGAIILVIFEMFTRSSTESYFPLLMVTLFIVGYAITAMKQKYTLVEYLTLKARDEREQYILDRTARQTYAFIRIVALTLVVILLSGVVKATTFTTTNIGYGILVVIFGAQLYFMAVLRKKLR